MNRTEFAPTSLALLAAVLWGFWWIPIRYLNEVGLLGAFAGLALNVGAGFFLLVWVLLGSGLQGLTWRSGLGALLVGMAVTSYATAISYTDVVRVVLLFYLAPAWSTIIECMFMGRRWDWRSLVALGLSFSGMLLILGDDVSATSLNGGDALALLSGLCWSVGAALVFSSRPVGTPLLSFAAVFGAAITGSMTVLAETWMDLPTPEISRVAEAVPIILATGGIYLAPIFAISLWSARKLPPALLSFLLSAEIVSGVASSAILLDERFGWVEMAGATCVALGAGVEFLLPSRTRRNS